jgi:hypothetical protein
MDSSIVAITALTVFAMFLVFILCFFGLAGGIFFFVKSRKSTISKRSKSSSRHRKNKSQICCHHVDFDTLDFLLKKEGLTPVQLLDGQKVDGQKVDGQKVDGQKVDGQKVDGQKVDGQKVDGQVSCGNIFQLVDHFAEHAPEDDGVDGYTYDDNDDSDDNDSNDDDDEWLIDGTCLDYYNVPLKVRCRNLKDIRLTYTVCDIMWYIISMYHLTNGGDFDEFQNFYLGKCTRSFTGFDLEDTQLFEMIRENTLDIIARYQEIFPDMITNFPPINDILHQVISNVVSITNKEHCD